MNKQIIFVGAIIILFNFLLLNIFKLQKEILGLENKIKNKNKNNDKNIQGIEKYPTKYKELDNNTNINSKLNDIADLVPIDINKVDKTNANFKSKVDQIESI